MGRFSTSMPAWVNRLAAWWDNCLAPVNIKNFALGAFVLIAIGALLRTPLVALMGVLLFLVALMFRLWWDFALRNLEYSRSFSRTRGFYGDEITMELTAVNSKPLPISRLDVAEQVSPQVDIRDHGLYPNAEARTLSFESLFSLGMYERVTHRYTLDCTHRGWQKFGPTMLRANDPFGVVTRTTTIPDISGILVYPRMVPITSVVVPARQPMGDFKPSTAMLEDPMRIAGVRPYVPGDSPRRIHWRATARTGDLQTRVFEPSASRVAAVFVDTIQFSHLWMGQVSKYLELSIVVAASLARQMIESRQQVGMYVNAPTGPNTRSVRVAPGRRGGQLQKILEQLAMVQPAYGDKIETMLSKELRRLPWGASVVVISSQISADFQRSLIRFARNSGVGRFVVIAIGDEPELFPEVRKRFEVYHMSGEEAWDVIETIHLTRIS